MEWFGEIPNHWEAKKINELFSERRETVSDTDYEPLSVSKGGIVPQIATVAKTNAGDNRRCVRVGDFVINSRSDRRGSSGVSYYDGSVSLINIVLTPRAECAGRFFHYLLRSHGFIEEYYRNGRGIVADLWTTRYSEMKTIYLPLPPRTEQDQIVRFLDWKMSRINRLINAKKKQIMLLGEQKQVVINTAVTQDDEGWQKKPLKYCVKSNVLSLGANTDSEYEMDYLDISSVGHGYVKQEPIHYTFSNAPSRARRIVKYGDTIISTVRTYLKSVCFIDHEFENCIVSTGFSVLTPNDNLLPELLFFVISSDEFIDDVIKNSIGVSYPAINDNKLMSLDISLPHSLDEQQILYRKIKSEFRILDIIISKINREINKLHEYRTRLISDVVTGKMNVLDVAVHEYEMVEEDVDNEQECELLTEDSE
jgi:type I restriction enzyme S subunit